MLRPDFRGSFVAKLATWHDDPLWPDRGIVDLYCHPNFWSKATTLLSQLPIPHGKRAIAYADTRCAEQLEALSNCGFQTLTTLPHWLATDYDELDSTDVVLLEKS